MALWTKKTEAPAKPAVPPVAAAAPVPAPAPAVVPPESAKPEASAAPMTPEALRSAAAMSKAVMAAFGEIVTILMRTQEHRGLPLAELESLVVPAVMTGQFAVAEAQSKVNGMMAPVGVIMWANVSPQVDARLRANIGSGVKLAADEWKSGDIFWIVDAIGDPKLLQAMIQRAANNEWKGRTVNLCVRTQDGTLRAGQLTPRPADQTVA